MVLAVKKKKELEEEKDKAIAKEVTLKSEYDAY
jgi:hypothetical protein